MKEVIIGKCKLCLTEGVRLLESHLMPAGFFRRLLSKEKNPHPLLLSDRGARSSSEQVTDNVLCEKCETRFHEHGEDYTLRKAADKSGFPLLEELLINASGEGREFRKSTIKDSPGVKRDQLVYFALSVFWRAAIHRRPELLTHKSICSSFLYPQHETTRSLAGEWRPLNTSMPLRTNVAISTLTLLAIVGGVRAVAEEHRRTREFLQSWYRELNRKYFDNSLPLARIEWADLTVYNRLGETYRDDDGTFVVLVDRRTNARNEDLQDTVFHEMCHVATWRKEDNPHGTAFRACMYGIKGKLLQDHSMKPR